MLYLDQFEWKITITIFYKSQFVTCGVLWKTIIVKFSYPMD
jgi:hypothetical protein